MKVNGQTMYVAQFEGGDYTYNSKDEAIDKLRENGDKIDPESEDVSIVRMNTERKRRERKSMKPKRGRSWSGRRRKSVIQRLLAKTRLVQIWTRR